MKLVSTGGIWYRDGFHPAGRPFEILDEDAEEMKQYGKLLVEIPAVKEEVPEPEEPKQEEAPKPKRTRTKKKAE